MNTLITTEEYRALISKQLKELLEFLLFKNKSFEVIANIDSVIFIPEIPSNIKKHFTRYTLFSISNYTLESLELHDNYLNFEAGFGENNFGSVCEIPYYGIFQITIENSILFINPTANFHPSFLNKDEEKKQTEKSRNAFRLNR